MASAKRTTDHQEIRRWVEERGGFPARVAGTGDGDDPGLLRIDYKGFSGEESLEPISWEQFFDKFDDTHLAFLYQDEEDSRFSKLVSRTSQKGDSEIRPERGGGQSRQQRRTGGGNTARDVMTEDPYTLTPDGSIQDAARAFAELDCGAIPVVDDDNMPVGMLTDRDIVTRALAHGDNALELKVRDCMTSPALTVGLDDDLEDVVHVMEQAQVRRAVVVDDEGRCCGLLAQADLAFAVDDALAAEMVRAISEPNDRAARLPG